MSDSTELAKTLLILLIFGVIAYLAQQWWTADVIQCNNDLVCQLGNWGMSVLAGGILAMTFSGLILSTTVYGGMPGQAQAGIGKTIGAFNFFIGFILAIIFFIPSIMLAQRVYQYFPSAIYFIVVFGYLLNYAIRKLRSA